MKKNTSVFLIIFLISALATACGKHENLAPFGWKKIDASTDSLMLALEQHWLRHDADSLIVPDLDRLRRMADSAPADNLLAVRNLYWQGRMALRREEYDEAEALFAKALLLNDSVTNPYETFRLRWATEAPQLPYTVETYKYLHDQAEFFEKAGDYMLASSRWMDLGMMLNDMGLPSRAEVLLDRSDSLSILGGFTEMMAGNRLNHAKVKYMAGDTLQAANLLREMITDPAIQSDRLAINIALDNLYVIAGDTAALFRAYEMAQDNPRLEVQKPYYHGCLTEVFLRRNEIDSALYHAHEASINFDLIETTRQQIDVMMWRAQAEQAAGNLMRACELFDSAHILTERYIDETRIDDVLNLDFHRQLAEMERNHDRRVYRHNMIIVTTCAIALALLFAILFMFYRRWQKHRRKQMQQQIDLEKSQRRLLAMRLNLQSKEALISSIGKKLSDEQSDARRSVETEIRLYEATSGRQSETFEQIFGDLHPEFASRVRSKWPMLSDADVRLISLVALKLSNREIALTLGIRPESVKQARWRLRNKMQLTPGETLDSAISGLC